MRVDRCKNAISEIVNGELFIKAPSACLSMSSPDGMSSCWIPREAFDVVRNYASSDGELLDAFMIVTMGSGDAVYQIREVIIFKGGDILALMEPVHFMGRGKYAH